MSIKDHLIKLTMWWQGAQKLRNDRPGGAAAPPAPSVLPLASTLSESLHFSQGRDLPLFSYVTTKYIESGENSVFGLTG